MQHFWAFRIGEHLVYLDARAYVHEGSFSIDSLKAEVACVYYLQISDEKRVKGLPLPRQLDFTLCSLHSSYFARSLTFYFC